MNEKMKLMYLRLVYLGASIYHIIWSFAYFQRIAHSLRKGGPCEIQLERFEEALHDPQSQLTYTALTGVRKQSVEDAERLFNENLISWMKEKNYEIEEKYLSVVSGWRKACDMRGLSDEQRSKYNMDFLNFILDDLMPWHKENRDFSLLEVNQ